MSHPTILERAYALARRGIPLTAIIRTLTREGHPNVASALDGRTVRRALKGLRAGSIADEAGGAGAGEAPEPLP